MLTVVDVKWNQKNTLKNQSIKLKYRAEAVASLEEALKLNPGAKATETKLEETKKQHAEEVAMASVEAFGSGI